MILHHVSNPSFSFFFLHPSRKVTLEEAFENLRNLAEASGMIEGIELLRTRPSENLFMCGVKGTLKLIEDGEYPQSSTQHDDTGHM